jgi:hypothetical protein
LVLGPWLRYGINGTTCLFQNFFSDGILGAVAESDPVAMPPMQMYSYLGFRIGVVFADKLLRLRRKQDESDFVLVPTYDNTSIVPRGSFSCLWTNRYRQYVVIK